MVPSGLIFLSSNSDNPDGAEHALRSIWDTPGDGDAPAAASAGRADGDVWRDAAAACAPAFVAAAAAFARLDERLRILPPEAQAAARARLAALQAVRLVWWTGVAVAPEALALDALDRRRADGALDDAAEVALAQRLARLLGRPPARRLVRGAHPFVRAAFGPAGPAPRTRVALEAVAAGLRLAARAGRGGAGFAPIPARRRWAGSAPEARLGALLADIADGATDAVELLDDLDAWRARAGAAAAAMKGATPGRVVALLARTPAISTPGAAAMLGLSDDAAGRALARLAEAGLARELTGHLRYRVWAARL